MCVYRVGEEVQINCLLVDRLLNYEELKDGLTFLTLGLIQKLGCTLDCLNSDCVLRVRRIYVDIWWPEGWVDWVRDTSLYIKIRSALMHFNQGPVRKTESPPGLSTRGNCIQGVGFTRDERTEG